MQDSDLPKKGVNNIDSRSDLLWIINLYHNKVWKSKKFKEKLKKKLKKNLKKKFEKKNWKKCQ